VRRGEITAAPVHAGSRLPGESSFSVRYVASLSGGRTALDVYGVVPRPVRKAFLELARED
jgi:hypothetical protein